MKNNTKTHTEDTQDFGHFLRLKHILKTGLTMQDVGVFHPLEKEIREKCAKLLQGKGEGA